LSRLEEEKVAPLFMVRELKSVLRSRGKEKQTLLSFEKDHKGIIGTSLNTSKSAQEREKDSSKEPKIIDEYNTFNNEDKNQDDDSLTEDACKETSKEEFAKKLELGLRLKFL